MYCHMCGKEVKPYKRYVTLSDDSPEVLAISDPQGLPERYTFIYKEGDKAKVLIGFCSPECSYEFSREWYKSKIQPNS